MTARGQHERPGNYNLFEEFSLVKTNRVVVNVLEE